MQSKGDGRGKRQVFELLKIFEHMVNFNIERYLKFGSVYEFTNQTSENEIYSILGKPSEIEDYGKNGRFLHYENLRLTITNDRLKVADLFLMNSDVNYTLGQDGEVLQINRKTSLLKILYFFNNSSLKWHIPFDKFKLDYLLVEVSSGLSIFYYYGTEELERISRIW